MERLNLDEDMLAEVLCRLSKKSLARFKCVSKKWLALISDRNRVFPKTTSTPSGLIFQTHLPLESRQQESTEQNSSSVLTFHRVDCKGNVACIASFLPSKTLHDFILLASCNGFLLFREDWTTTRSTMGKFVVLHPATSRSWRFSMRDGMLLGLVSDGQNFKLIAFAAWLKLRMLAVMSSEKKEEREETWRSEISNPSTSRWFKNLDAAKCVFLNGAFHWIWGLYLLIYCLGDRDCKHVKLPTFPKNGGQRKRKHQCIWDSEGSVNYCQVSASSDRIGIWTLLHKGGGQNHKPDACPFKWKIRHLGALTPSIRTLEIEHPISFSPFAFNDDFEIVYLMCRRRIFLYSLATGELKEVCTSPFEGSDDRALCIALPIQDLCQFDIEDETTWGEEVCNPCSGEIAKTMQQQEI